MLQAQCNRQAIASALSGLANGSLFRLVTNYILVAVVECGFDIRSVDFPAQYDTPDDAPDICHELHAIVVLAAPLRAHIPAGEQWRCQCSVVALVNEPWDTADQFWVQVSNAGTNFEQNFESRALTDPIAFKSAIHDMLTAATFGQEAHRELFKVMLGIGLVGIPRVDNG